MTLLLCHQRMLPLMSSLLVGRQQLGKEVGPECCLVELLFVLDDRQIVHHRF
jgi:hypothetical protein